MRQTRALRKFIRREIGRSLRQATVKAVGGATVNVQVGGSPRYLRGLPVVGGVDNVVVGDTVVLYEADGQIYAEATKAKAGHRYGNKSGAAVAAVTGTHSHLTSAQGGVLDGYVQVAGVDTITAQHIFSPSTPKAPFLLGGNAQQQTVVGFRADELNKSVNTGSLLKGGGALTGSLTLNIDLTAVFAWAADHSWDADTMYIDVSEDAVYINAGTLPTTRGALTVWAATGDQSALIVKRPWYAMGYSAKLLRIIDENDDDLIIITNKGDLESGNPGFVSGQKGWQISYDGNAEFNNLFVRGELHACVFVADEMHATGGTLAVMTASKVADWKTSPENRLPGALNDPFTLVVQASWDTGLCYIADNHVLRIKTMAEVAVTGSLDLWDIWVEVDGAPISNTDRDLANGEPGTFDVNCIWRQGGEANLYIPTGAAAVHWGTIGTIKGGLILTSDLNYSPYMDIFTIPTHHPWSAGTTPHVRVGNLDGVLSLGEEWGIAAGKNLSSTTEPHIVMSDQRLRLWGVAQRWWDTSGNTRGEVDPSAGPTDVLFWLGPSEAGAQFKVLGDGSVWASSVMLSESLGQWLFSKAGGLLLLGPNCEISDSRWVSLRKQVATITGAFHQEAGRWLGTRGLMVEAWGTNKVKNPTFGGSVLTSWSAIPAATISAETDYPYICDACMKIVAPTDYDGARITFTLLPATTYHLSLRMRSDSNVEVAMQLRDEDAGADNKREYKDLVAGQGWKLYEYSFTTHAVNTHYALQIWAAVGDSGTWYVDAVQVEQRGYRTSITSGDLDWCTWVGAAHASDSSRTATTVSIPTDGTLEIANGSIALWVHIDGEPDVYRTYFSHADGSGNNRHQFYYNQTQNKYYFRTANNAGAATMVGTQATLGDGWHHIVCTWDVASTTMQLYVDGALDASSTSANLPSVLQSTLYIGTWKGTTQWGNSRIGEFATFGKALSAAEAAAIYALQRPLVDAGAIDSPGLYILDGRFKIASSLTGQHVDITPEGIGIYSGTGPTSVARLLGGQVNTTTKLLEAGGDSLGWFGYDDSNILQVAWYASGARKGEITAGAGAIRLKSTGKETHGTGDADIYDKWYNSDITVYTTAFGFANLQKTDPDSHTYGIMNFGIRHNATNQSNVACWLNEVDLAVQKAGAWRYLLQANYNFVRISGVPFRVGIGTADPTVALEDGQLFYRTDTDKLRLRANGAWVNLN